MPYIKQERRKEFEPWLENQPAVPCTPGELNYVFTILAKQYVEEFGLSYQTINDVIGALEGAKMEFYRRVAVPYEDQKIKENGDVY